MRKKPASNQQKPSGFIRIISGRFRGRKLPVRDVNGLRPTTDRVKETLFNWLMQSTHGSRVLDCFAGSGGLALEALSRHAEYAMLCEKDKEAASQLKANIASLQLDNAEVRQGDSLQLLATPPPQAFDLVFVDPPFRLGLAGPVCQLLEQHQWLAEGALIYVEVEKELTLTEIPHSWSLLKEKTAGQVTCRLFERQG